MEVSGYKFIEVIPGEIAPLDGDLSTPARYGGSSFMAGGSRIRSRCARLKTE